MAVLGKLVSFRISSDIFKKLDFILLNNSFKYKNVSHIVRVAVVKLIEEEYKLFLDGKKDKGILVK
jgi:hypothetical protein